MSRFFTEINKNRWRPLRAHDIDFVSSKSTTISERSWFSSQYSETTAVFLVPRGPLLKKKAVITRFRQENTPTSRSSLADAEEDLMFKRGEFGNKHPEILQKTVWWLLSLQFGFQAPDESRKLN